MSLSRASIVLSVGRDGWNGMKHSIAENRREWLSKHLLLSTPILTKKTKITVYLE